MPVLEHRTAHQIEPLPRPEELPDTFPKGRRCTVDGCITVLSRYNPGDRCYHHTDQQAARLCERALEARRFAGRGRLSAAEQAERDALIRELRREGMSDMELAATFELGSSTIGQIVRGRKR